MSHSEKTAGGLEYHFGDFCLSDARQALLRGTETIPLSTKIYYLLLTLVQNAGTILSKDDIIESVWPGQVVTDAALAQQMLRLRQMLDDNDPEQPFIETHRGVGYRFAIPVEERRPASGAGRDGNTAFASWHGVLLVFVVALGAWFFFRDSGQPAETAQVQDGQRDAIGLAVVPVFDDEGWLNRGGLSYFSELLGAQEQVFTVTPENDWFEGESNDRLAIELTSTEEIDYSVLVGFGELDGEFTANVALRSDNEVFASTHIRSATLPDLITRTAEWTNASISVHHGLEDIGAALPETTDSYALQSYLMGIRETEVGNDLSKAGEYFKAAVNTDPDFRTAWVSLADNLVRRGDYSRAIAIAETQLALIQPGSDPRTEIDLHLVKANAFFALRDFEKGEIEARLGLESVENSPDPYIKLAGLESLALLATMQKDWETVEQHTRQRLEIAQQYLPLPGKLAGLHLELARVQQQRNDFKSARENLALALRYYENTGDANGMLAGLLVLNRINLKEGRYEQGVQVTARGDSFLDQASDIRTTMQFLQEGTRMLMLRGHFDKADEYIIRMQEIAAQSESEMWAIIAEFIKLLSFYLRGEYELAKQHMEITNRLFEGNYELPDSRVYFKTVDILISSRVDPPGEVLEKIARYSREEPLMRERYPLEVERGEGIALARAGEVERGLELLESVEQGFRERGDDNLANFVLYEMCEILLEHPQFDHETVLERLQTLSSHRYQKLKIKARFLAREGRFDEAARLMEENKWQANEYWTADDQLLLERYTQQARAASA